MRGSIVLFLFVFFVAETRGHPVPKSKQHLVKVRTLETRPKIDGDSNAKKSMPGGPHYDGEDSPSAMFWIVIAFGSVCLVVLLGIAIYWCACPTWKGKSNSPAPAATPTPQQPALTKERLWGNANYYAGVVAQYPPPPLVVGSRAQPQATK